MLRKINLDDIKISRSFARTHPRESKVQAVENYYKCHKRVDKNIILDHDNNLVDGYIRYLVLKAHGKKSTRQYEYATQIYIYGKHSDNGKEFVWRLDNNTKNKESIKVGVKAKVKTKWGLKPITVTKIKELNKPPIKGKIKAVTAII